MLLPKRSSLVSIHQHRRHPRLRQLLVVEDGEAAAALEIIILTVKSFCQHHHQYPNWLIFPRRGGYVITAIKRAMTTKINGTEHRPRIEVITVTSIIIFNNGSNNGWSFTKCLVTLTGYDVLGKENHSNSDGRKYIGYTG